jgi:hypothetical protein
MQLFAAICCCVVAACSGFVHHWYRLQGMSDRVNTRKQACIRTIACCATRMVSCSCLQAVLNTVVCGLWQGFVQHGNTAKYGLQGMSDRIDTRNRHAHLYSSVLQLSLCSCGCLQSGYCRMHRVLCSMSKPDSLQGPLYRRNTFKKGAVMSASMLGSLSCSYAVFCC